MGVGRLEARHGSQLNQGSTLDHILTSIGRGK